MFAGQPLKHTDFDALPDQMCAAKRWLLYKLVPNIDPTKKPRKTPSYVDGALRGKTDTPDDLARLAPFEDALRCLEGGNYTGLGFALGPDGTGNHWQGIDLDNLDQHPRLADLVKTLPGYVEKSPSGNGVHAIGYGKLFTTLGSNGTGIEAYSAGRFFTVTGDAL
jgi:primase-polymerase (primpol)-like protein